MCFRKPIFMLLVLTTSLSGCVPHAEYRAYQDQLDGHDVFLVNDNRVRVESSKYPVFSIREVREAPRSNVNDDWEGAYNPPILMDYKWVVTHSFNGRFLIHSIEYDSDYCKERLGMSGSRHSRPKNCAIGKKGAPNKIYVYVRPNGEAYGWQYMRNQDWYVLRSDKISRFRIDDSGDWSGQPWFECVARCDKLERMWREEVEGGDPFEVKVDKKGELNGL
ncbi:hypothetical protein [Aidingimonas halophila]|uniref:Lipoprotein n=1 Tax=Aidingimonas halophila TaxID=574349 RepID=A0A1H2WZD0_9GAMM|nr:hypothetical protein [Aidingimonas halophila]GHC27805.1 hypothetical protein GCM10008094_19320 [Aidingimonas halophila]SDW85604.1 hypothetical protein SAMN05443545_10352 [Aidingimonas halophila]